MTEAIQRTSSSVATAVLPEDMPLSDLTPGEMLAAAILLGCIPSLPEQTRKSLIISERMERISKHLAEIDDQDSQLQYKVIPKDCDPATSNSINSENRRIAALKSGLQSLRTRDNMEASVVTANFNATSASIQNIAGIASGEIKNFGDIMKSTTSGGRRG